WGSDDKDEIVAMKKRNDLFASGRKKSGEQPVVFGKSATSAHRRGPDAGVMPFGQPDNFIEGVVAIDGRSHNKDRTFALIECFANSLHHSRLRPYFAAHHALGDPLRGPFPIICGYR